MSDWQNRIISYGEEPAGSFLANSANWRVHGKNQKDALTGALNDVGWVQDVMVNMRSGDEWPEDERGVQTLIDGHLRVSLALSRDENEPVPVKYVDLTPLEEAEVLATFDPIGAMAEADRVQLESLLQDVQSGEPGVQAMLAELAEREGIVAELEPVEDAETDGDISTVDGDMPPLSDYVFETDNEFGIPSLDASMQAVALEAPVLRYGQKTRHSGGVAVGTLHFYTEDYKFNALWREPLPQILADASCVIEPNYSTNDVMPKVVVLYGIFRKRWLARFWQKCGLRVVVDLNVEPKFDALNLLGVPVGWKAYATRFYDELGEPELMRQYELAQAHAGCDDVLFVVMGGGQIGEGICQRHAWTFIPQENHIMEGRHG